MDSQDHKQIKILIMLLKILIDNCALYCSKFLLSINSHLQCYESCLTPFKNFFMSSKITLEPI